MRDTLTELEARRDEMLQANHTARMSSDEQVWSDEEIEAINEQIRQARSS